MTTTWRKSTYSHDNGCVSFATGDDDVLVRNSNHPERGTIAVAPAAVAAFVASCSAGELDDLRG